MRRTPAARARGISKRFGQVVALDGVDLDVDPGQIHGLVGPNGAGKTTLLGLLLGLAVADGGTLEILGAPVGGALAIPTVSPASWTGPGSIRRSPPGRTSPRWPSLRGHDARTAGIDDALDQVGLTDVADDRVRGFSLGMRQRLGLAAALLTRPRLLVLDEPSNGLDPAGKRHVHGVITGSRRTGPRWCSPATGWTTWRRCAPRSPSSPPDGSSSPARSSKLAAESGELDYRLLTSDPTKAAGRAGRRHPGSASLDDTAVARRRGARRARRRCPPSTNWWCGSSRRASRVRELAPVVSPLEAAFLALTEHQEADR